MIEQSHSPTINNQNIVYVCVCLASQPTIMAEKRKTDIRTFFSAPKRKVRTL